MNKWLILPSKISVHPLYLLIACIGILTANFWSVLFVTIIIFFHELGHAIAATFFDWRINKITLLPFGGVVDLDEHGNRPTYEEFIVTISGPIQHLTLFIIAKFLFQLNFMPENLYSLFISFNVSILFFNLLPIWPLDGGKLIYQLFSVIFPFVKAHQYSLYSSFIFLVLSSIITLLIQPTNITIWVCLLFLMVSLWGEWKNRHFVVIRFLMERFYGNKQYIQKIKSISLTKETKLFQVFSNFQKGYKYNVVFSLDRKTQQMLDENELLHAYFTEKKATHSLEELIG
ncbi:M50 family metallopeptidase [Gottfriedia luciferensis]|uniref:M50 family metallopeptidase n=1 Tax=Gottfriedia luciferensis TaxID=178774 RepID=UPI000B42E595|nr:M50 family metallopeptidase [Gottfriedia luciferensis]